LLPRDNQEYGEGRVSHPTLSVRDPNKCTAMTKQFTLANGSTLSDSQIERVLRAVGHWCPYNQVRIEVQPSGCPYGAYVWPGERRIRVSMGDPSMFPFTDNWTPKVSWGRVTTRPQALIGLLAHEFWHMRQYRGGHPLDEWSADYAAVHALTCWRTGRRRNIPLYRG